jgi:hypothetical protein
VINALRAAIAGDASEVVDGALDALDAQPAATTSAARAPRRDDRRASARRKEASIRAECGVGQRRRKIGLIEGDEHVSLNGTLLEATETDRSMQAREARDRRIVSVRIRERCRKRRVNMVIPVKRVGSHARFHELTW